MTQRINVPGKDPTNWGQIAGIGGTVLGGVLGTVLLPGPGTAAGAGGGGALAGALTGASIGGAVGTAGGAGADAVAASEGSYKGIGMSGDTAIQRRIKQQSVNPGEQIQNALAVAQSLPPALRAQYGKPLEQAYDKYKVQNYDYEDPLNANKTNG